MLDEMGDARASELGSMIRLAMVEAIHPGAFEAVYGPLDEGAGSAGLTTDELALVQTALELSTALHDELDADFVDVDRVGALLDGAVESVRSQRLLEITDARLCLRVDNFGVYREVERHDGRYKFVAGRAHPAIVYCELDQFTRAPPTATASTATSSMSGRPLRSTASAPRTPETPRAPSSGSSTRSPLSTSRVASCEISSSCRSSNCPRTCRSARIG
ncbi:MAG: hypothetical protein ACFHWZ_02485 [Phycisphaerales bacterium]